MRPTTPQRGGLGEAWLVAGEVIYTNSKACRARAHLERNKPKRSWPGTCPQAVAANILLTLHHHALHRHRP